MEVCAIHTNIDFPALFWKKISAFHKKLQINSLLSSQIAATTNQTSKEFQKHPKVTKFGLKM
jgi:hypothetical protein